VALQALAHAACGDQVRALAALDKALTLAAPEGHLRVFVDEGPQMAPYPASYCSAVDSRWRLPAPRGTT
jgi:MalT-like TPR region